MYLPCLQECGLPEKLSLALVPRLNILRITVKPTKKTQKQFWGFNRIWTHDLRDTGAMLYQLSYEASLEAGQVWVQFIYLKKKLSYSKLQ